ncbi:MAG: histidinol-phosphatase HisJ family protein, partial [Clostridia bacterium]|nr:histidinol-phosphatase HisJ family protein [Clostridia bacterium]
MLIDIHLHSGFSFDSKEKTENYVVSAFNTGVPAIGFSEHYDYDALLDGADIAVADIPEYVAHINEIKTRYSRPEILCGIEFGYRDVAVEKYVNLIKEYDFDYVINSVHTLADRGDCFHDRFFEGKTLKESYYDYLKAVLESVRAEFDYQIIGHIGYVSRYRSGSGAKIRYGDFSDIIDEILREIISRGKCLEINTSTGSSECDYLPDCDIIERYLQLGGEKLSFGSDAHRVGDYQRKSE